MASRLARSAVGTYSPQKPPHLPLDPSLTRNRRRPSPPIAPSPHDSLHRRAGPLPIEHAPGGPQEEGPDPARVDTRARQQPPHKGRRALRRSWSQCRSHQQRALRGQRGVHRRPVTPDHLLGCRKVCRSRVGRLRPAAGGQDLGHPERSPCRPHLGRQVAHPERPGPRRCH